jgi:hypothetical protein
MMRAKCLGGIGASTLAALASSAMGVGDCCTAKVTTASFRNERIDALACSSVWSSTHRDDGKFCFPLGSGYGPGLETTLTVGQEFELNASFNLGNDAGGVTVGMARKFTVSQAFTHTAPQGQNCQLYLSYDEAVMRHWTVQRFCVLGDRTYTHTTFTSFGTTTVVPCCEPARGGAPNTDGQAANGSPACTDPVVVAEGGASPRATMALDLREQSSFEPHNLPSWHPMNQPGSDLATMNGWQRREIMRGVREMEAIQGFPMSELVIFDLDGSFVIWDLEADPSGLVPCPADADSNGLVDSSDIVLFVNYFLSDDPAADVDGSGLLDLRDITGFVESTLAGCP